MRKRLVVFLALAALILGADYLTLWLTTPKKHVTRAAFDRIQEGMTLAEVEGLIGLPPGDHRTRPTRIVWGVRGPIIFLEPATQGRKYTSMEWIGDYGMICVWLDSEEKVVERAFTELRPDEPSLLDRLRKLMGL
jgi:hypothetical protein